MKHPSARSLTSLVILLSTTLALTAQSPQQSGTLVIAGHPGQAPIVQINGKSYVDIESLARLTHGSLSFHSNQITLALPGSPPTNTPAAKTPPTGFSSDFLKAAIEVMTEIREWRVAIVNAVQTNNPVDEVWVSRFSRAAHSKLALASASIQTEADRNAFQLVTNGFNNMQQLSDHYVQRRRNHQFTPTDSFNNDPLDQKVLGCAQGLAALAVNNQFQDVPSCH
jgi:hypothetical protein